MSGTIAYEKGNLAHIGLSRAGYTIVDNRVFRIKELSWQALGCYLKILSLPPTWYLTMKSLGKAMPEGRIAVESAVQELEAAGLLVRCRRRGEDGKLGSACWVTLDDPAAQYAGTVAAINRAGYLPLNVQQNLLNAPIPEVQVSFLEGANVAHATVHRTGYTVVDNAICRMEGISAKAIGAYAQIRSLPDTWKFTVNGLSALKSNGVKATTTAIAELERRRLLIRSRKRVSGHYSSETYWATLDDPKEQYNRACRMLEEAGYEVLKPAAGEPPANPAPPSKTPSKTPSKASSGKPRKAAGAAPQAPSRQNAAKTGNQAKPQVTPNAQVSAHGPETDCGKLGPNGAKPQVTPNAQVSADRCGGEFAKPQVTPNAQVSAANTVMYIQEPTNSHSELVSRFLNISEEYDMGTDSAGARAAARSTAHTPASPQDATHPLQAQPIPGSPAPATHPLQAQPIPDTPAPETRRPQANAQPQPAMDAREGAGAPKPSALRVDEAFSRLLASSPNKNRAEEAKKRYRKALNKGLTPYAIQTAFDAYRVKMRRENVAPAYHMSLDSFLTESQEGGLWDYLEVVEAVTGMKGGTESEAIYRFCKSSDEAMEARNAMLKAESAAALARLRGCPTEKAMSAAKAASAEFDKMLRRWRFGVIIANLPKPAFC